MQNGLRYLSTELVGAPKGLEVPDREHPSSEEDARKLASHPLPVIR